MKLKRRTNIDFSNHELLITKNELIKIHHLKQPNTMVDSIKFINTERILAVTGDYGNWIFCREFNPSHDGYVSDYYWLEKLKISSSQEGTKFSGDKTKAEINDLIDKRVDDTWCPEHRDDAISYYKSLLDYVSCGEHEYLEYAYNNYPDFMDYECVPIVNEIKYWLKAVFDGFEEICKRLKNEKPI